MARLAAPLIAFLLAATVTFCLIAWFDVGSIPVESLRKTAPRRTALMRQREAEARRKGRSYRIDQRWVPLGRISPMLQRAVLVAEDDAFMSHGGLDWKEIEASARKNWEARRIVRGGSTITQQLAKNLYLGDARTPLRKLRELFLALRIERALTKRRILELYLNLIEWGDGIYGAEAAARRHFGVSASALGPRQALPLAAVIINPRRFDPAHPNRRIERRVTMIASRMRRRGLLNAEQVQAALGRQVEPARPFSDWFFGTAPDTAPPAEIPGAPLPEPEPPPPEESPEAPPDSAPPPGSPS